MQDSIYTIPISEVFEPKDGCPICRMRDMLETRGIDYIMGAAMMEPDVRIETNRLGFCKLHYDKMLQQKNRLSLALMLESHLKEIQEKGIKQYIPASSGGLFKKKERSKPEETCFVCSKIQWAEERFFDTILKMYGQSEEFRGLFREQEKLCFPHYQELCAFASERMNKKLLPDFLKDTGSLCQKALDELGKDVSHYCKMFDYRNTGAEADWGNSRDSIERAIAFLTSREPEKKK